MAVEFDDLDRALVHALQVDGRAPFRRVAEVLGVSDQTVARRYARLRTARTLRIVGFSDPTVVGDEQWHVRLRCAPDACVEIAEALARRPDTSWIGLIAGGTEIACSLRGRSATADEMLLHRLPRTPRILDVSAHEVLHVFYGGAREPFTKLGALDDEQVARLSEHLPAAVPAPRLDDVDRHLLDLLRADGRAPVEDLARTCGTSASTVRRRLHDLRGSGLLYLDVDVDPEVMDLPLRTMLWLAVAPADLDAAGRALAAHPEVPFAAAIAGKANIYASVATTGAAGLYRYLTTRVATLPGVQSVETAPVIRTVKAAGTHYPVR
ncbi:AsnC family transcriptional regulator [Actinomycetospora sp. NBRC 106375]|uniref:Lrp/AsnC family transcriptional regulator n=1 Tax=Actinomycetospora sp. NBRC 106375 TaxID=3032207 RepID=UPI0024A4067F|nr:AsnC family transcriptional regulator [Actinomycetospora sp. NBRC 106375]GLZ45337.1 AsnC family transcriptional regulator [Actinomycetospora sp. NBRC 106375]